MIGVFFVIGATCLWALDTLIRYPLIADGMAAEKLVFTEHLLLVLFFIPGLIHKRKLIWQARVSHLFYLAILGGLGSAVATLAFTRAFGLINPSLVILLQKIQPLVAISLAALVLKEPIKKEFLLWAGLCLLGGMMISYNDIAPGLTDLDFSSLSKDSSVIGYALALVAALSWGAATVFGKLLTKEGYSGLEIMGGRFFFGLLFLAPIATSQGFSLPNEEKTWGQIIFLVSMSGMLGMYLYYQGLKRIPARLCTLAEMFFPFCAIAVNWVFLGATLQPLQIAGGLILLLSSTVIQLKHY
jgi:drug/metabolite transporter (DMT)-like permease